MAKQVIYGLDDLGFDAENLEDLKKKVEGFYGSYGSKADVRIEDGHVLVTIDAKLAEKASTLVNQALAKCNKSRFDEAYKIARQMYDGGMKG